MKMMPTRLRASISLARVFALPPSKPSTASSRLTVANDMPAAALNTS